MLNQGFFWHLMEVMGNLGVPEVTFRSDCCTLVTVQVTTNRTDSTCVLLTPIKSITVASSPALGPTKRSGLWNLIQLFFSMPFGNVLLSHTLV